jgi:hypothetical protein
VKCLSLKKDIHEYAKTPQSYFIKKRTIIAVGLQ